MSKRSIPLSFPSSFRMNKIDAGLYFTLFNILFNSILFSQEAINYTPIRHSQFVIKFHGNMYWHDETLFFKKRSSVESDSRVVPDENPYRKYSPTGENGYGFKSLGIELNYYRMKSEKSFRSVGISYDYYSSYYDFYYRFYDYTHPLTQGQTRIVREGQGEGEIINHLIKFNIGFHYEMNYVNFFIQPLNPELKLSLNRESQINYTTYKEGPFMVPQTSRQDSVISRETKNDGFSLAAGVALPTTLGFEATIPARNSFIKIGPSVTVSVFHWYFAARINVGYVIPHKRTK